MKICSGRLILRQDRFETISLGGPTHDPVSIFQYNGSFAESPKGYYPFQSSTLHVLDIFNLTGAADRAGNIGSGEPFKQIITLEWGLINDTATV